MKEYELALENSKRIPGKVKILPLISFVLYHKKLIQKLDNLKVTPKDLNEIFIEHREMNKIIEESQNMD